MLRRRGYSASPKEPPPLGVGASDILVRLKLK